MRTNQLLSIDIKGELVRAHHKTGEIDVNDLLKIGNKLRVLDGKNPMLMPQLKRNTELKHFISAVEADVKAGEYSYYEVNPNLLRAVGRGNKATTLAFLPVALKIASIMHTPFEATLYRIFIEGHLLTLRDDGGNNFKRLNKAIDDYLPGREGKSGNRGCYIQSAKMLRKKIFPEIKGEVDSNIWNTKLATSDKQGLRADYEEKLVSFLEMDLVRDWEHLKELINKL